jgi:hypothetical protein
MKTTGRGSEIVEGASTQTNAHVVSQDVVSELQYLRKQVTQLSRRVENMVQLREQVDKGAQMLLSHHYRELASRGVILPFPDVGFRNYTQWEEDGIVHYIFSLIGTTSARRSVEMCAGVGSECMSANLILNHGWYSLLVDGDLNKVNSGREFFSQHPSTKNSGPKFLQRWIDRESVNTMVKDAGFAGEIDMLALDLDGVDYWIWDALTAISPRVVVVEVMPHLGEKVITVPYKADFEARWIMLDEDAEEAQGDGQRIGLVNTFTVYAGASLPAFVKLGKSKGYRLVGATAIGCNAFFMRNDVGADYFPEVDWSTCVNPHYNVEERKWIQEVLARYEWVDV